MIPPPKATLAELLMMWSTEDALLQRYRILFVTMQSIFVGFVAVGFELGAPCFSLAVLTGLALLGLGFWVSVCSARGRSVSLLQYLVLTAERGEDVRQPLKMLKEFQDGDRNGIARDPAFAALWGSNTRWKLDRILPCAFLLGWLLLWTSAVLQS
jgi:hypothetical protein